jgi:hypothetical protein
MKALARLCLLTALFLAACSRGDGNGTAVAADLGQPGTIASRDALYEHLQEFDSIGIAANRDETHLPENVLPKLHGWLAEGKGLKRIKIDGREALVIRRLPDAVYRQLQNVAFPETFPSGFEVLQASFWKGVRAAMDEGLTIGFLEPDPSFNVSGVFYETYNWHRGLILIDVFAGEGTLQHEHRHYLQSLDFNKRENARSWYDPGPTVIAEACLTATNRFLGELDSTTTEFPNWIGVFQTLDVAPAWHRDARKGQADPVRFPQSFILVTNLDYPGRSATGLQGQDCPDELLAAVAKIKSSTDDFETRVTDGYTSKLFSLRMEHFHAAVALNSVCGSATGALADACEHKRQRLAAIPAEAQGIKDSLDTLLRAEAVDRPARIKAAFGALSPELQSDLCEYGNAYGFLVDCRPFLNAKKEGGAP